MEDYKPPLDHRNCGGCKVHDAGRALVTMLLEHRRQQLGGIPGLVQAPFLDACPSYHIKALVTPRTVRLQAHVLQGTAVVSAGMMSSPDSAPRSNAEAQKNESVLTRIRLQYECLVRDLTKAPAVSPAPGDSIGIDNGQRLQYDLKQIRDLLSPDEPIVQVVGDSGTPFDDNKIGAAQAILSIYITKDTAIEYGFTAARHDTNWLVNEYKSAHPEIRLIANIVDEAISALESGMSGSSDIYTSVLLFDRLRPTRFGDDVWLSDGIMCKDRGDKMLCFEGGPQALYQCSNVLLQGIQVVAVIKLRSGRFSAARFLSAFMDGSTAVGTYLSDAKFTAKQLNVARWCLQRLEGSTHDIRSLIIPIDASKQA